VRAVVAQLREHGSVSRGWLGVQIQDLTPDLAEGVGLEGVQGAIVASVVAGSPAESAGFQTGDVILEIDGDELEGSVDLTRRVGNMRPGESARFTVFRDGRRQTITATLERRNVDRLAGLGAQSGEDGTSVGALGLQVTPLTPALRQQYDIAPNVMGVLVVSVDPESDAAAKGMSPGDVIVRVGNLDVQLPSDVEDALDDARSMGRDSVLLLVTNDTGQRFIALDILQE
jgi:serine protease Do